MKNPTTLAEQLDSCHSLPYAKIEEIIAAPSLVHHPESKVPPKPEKPDRE